MEKGELHSYNVLLIEVKIKIRIYFFVLTWSFLKFLRRLIIVYYRQKTR
jgi:hypothetical protein